MEVTKYEQLVEETRALVLEYAGQEDWPVVKNSVSSMLILAS